METFPIDDSYSPVLHRIDNAIRARAIHSDQPILPPSERLTKYSHPPEDLIQNSQKHLEKLIEIADVKKGWANPPKQ